MIRDDLYILPINDMYISCVHIQVHDKVYDEQYIRQIICIIDGILLNDAEIMYSCSDQILCE